MRKFDYSFLYSSQIPGKTISLLVAIEKVKAEGKVFELKYPDVFQNLEKIAIVQSVKSSNEIEGIITTNKRMKSILNEDTTPKNHDEEEIVGYRDVLEMIHTEYDNYQLDTDTLLEFHNTLLSYTGFEHGGTYKKINNVIMDIDSQGNRSVRFRPISAKETEKAMEQMIFAYLDAYQDSKISKLLLIPSVIMDFLCIHPFTDGNGRMSRLISLLLLYQNGYTVGKYVSYEGMINKNKKSYYETLRLSSVDWHDNRNDYYLFINDFLENLLRCYNDLYRRFELIVDQKDNKRNRVRETLLKSRFHMSRQDVYNIWPDISQETIKKVIKEMLKNNEIEKIGKYKDAKYKRV